MLLAAAALFGVTAGDTLFADSMEVLPAQYVSHMLNGHARVVEASEAGSATDISAFLSSLDGGSEKWINISPDGEWLLMESSRLHNYCGSWHCLVYGRRDLTQFAAIETTSGDVIHPEGFSAIASDGNLIAAHVRQGGRDDIVVSQNLGAYWSAPESITFASPSGYNHTPAISSDGQEILFGCGNDICSVNIDGTNLTTLISPSDKPEGGSWSQIKHADFDPYGNVVFEAEDSAERIWTYNRQTGLISSVNSGLTNDNSPCVLPDGQIASLWLNRPGSSGDHELKVMNSSGSSYVMVIQNTDVGDLGTGCGGG